MIGQGLPVEISLGKQVEKAATYIIVFLCLLQKGKLLLLFNWSHVLQLYLFYTIVFMQNVAFIAHKFAAIMSSLIISK